MQGVFATVHGGAGTDLGVEEDHDPPRLLGQADDLEEDTAGQLDGEVVEDLLVVRAGDVAQLGEAPCNPRSREHGGHLYKQGIWVTR